MDVGVGAVLHAEQLFSRRSADAVVHEPVKLLGAAATPLPCCAGCLRRAARLATSRHVQGPNSRFPVKHGADSLQPGPQEVIDDPPAPFSRCLRSTERPPISFRRNLTLPPKAFRLASRPVPTDGPLFLDSYAANLATRQGRDAHCLQLRTTLD